MSDFGTFSLADIAQQAEASQLRRQQMEMQQRRQDLDERKFFADLQGEQREQVEAAVKDLAAAVQWAQTPEQWAIVQQHYGQYDPQLAQVPFEHRQEALVRLGQMGEYLKQTKPEIRAIEPGGGLYSVNPQGNVTELVRQNPGTAEPFTPVQGGEERKTVNGRSFVRRNGQWFEETGGGAGNSRSQAVQGLVQQGITDPRQILDYLNRTDKGEVVGDFTLEEVQTLLRGGGASNGAGGFPSGL